MHLTEQLGANLNRTHTCLGYVKPGLDLKGKEKQLYVKSKSTEK